MNLNNEPTDTVIVHRGNRGELGKPSGRTRRRDARDRLTLEQRRQATKQRKARERAT